NLP
ncbi:oligopeptidase F family protein, partial [Vibrio parahaemolyticus V-223/04]